MGEEGGKSNVEKIQEAADNSGQEEFADQIESFQEDTDTATVRPSGTEGIKLSGKKIVEEKSGFKLLIQSQKQILIKISAQRRKMPDRF